MLNFSNRQTTLDLNGPVLSIVQQPTSVSICNAGVATFVGIATATFPTQTPANNPTNTGILTQRWYINGYGPLVDGSIVALGITVVGSATTTLTISGAISPTANGLGFFMRPDYIPSAYSQPVGSAVVAGTARSTGNGNNEPYDSSVATLTVFPTITITNEPEDVSVSATRTATFDVFAEVSDTTQGDLSYQWQLNGTNLSNSSTITGAASTSLSITLDTVGINTIQAVISHPSSCDSPKLSRSAILTVVEPRQILNVESNPTNYGTIASLSSFNLFDFGASGILMPSGGQTIVFYAPERDINVELEVYASTGLSYGSNLGGQGGYSKVRFTMKQNEEFTIAGYNFGNTAFIYRKSELMMVVGAGGNAGPDGKGGDGGGVDVAGLPGSGRGAGLGGARIDPGQLGTNGIFGSTVNPNTTLYSGDSVASFPNGGVVIKCPKGYWTQVGYSPCQDIGLQQYYDASGNRVTNTAFIQRGFKAGYGIRNTAGAGDYGANGGSGSTGGQGGVGGGGGGGAGGYHDGTIEVIETRSGGSNFSTAQLYIRSQDFV